MLTSIKAKREGNAYGVDEKSDPQAQKAFGVIIKQKELKVSIEQGVTDGTPGDAKLAAQCVKKLTDCYPGYSWVVEIDNRFSVGMVYIYNQDVNSALWGNLPYGYKLHIKTVLNDPSLMCVMRAGGEILERASLSRGWNKGEEPTRVDGVIESHQPKKIIIQ